MIDPTVRRAGELDAVQISVLEAEARQALVGARGGARWLTDHPERGAAWNRTIAQDQVFVAVVDEVVVGYIAGVIENSVGVVEEIFVHPEARECGFGTALLEVVIDAFVERGATVVDGSALPGDRETKNLYERAGITARLITLSAPIGSVAVSS